MGRGSNSSNPLSVQAILRTSYPPPGFDVELLESIRSQGRAEVDSDAEYADENFGCHLIAPRVAAELGIECESGIVLDPEATELQADGSYKLIGYYDHYWNVLPDGAILDVTNREFYPHGNQDYLLYGDLGESADPLENPEGFQAFLQEREQ